MEKDLAWPAGGERNKQRKSQTYEFFPMP